MENHEFNDDPLSQRLEAERPVPRAGFRAELRNQLLQAADRHRVAPGRLRLLIGAYAGAGAALLLIVAIGVGGAGPFAA